MATTIQQAFLTLKSRLEITAPQQSVVSTRQQAVREAVENGLVVSDTFLTGSYARSTLIGPLKDADIDVFAVLDSQYFHRYDNGQNGGQAGLLDLVKRTLLKTYTRTPDISRNGQAVTIRFEDFMVDIVPAFERNGGGFIIPNSVSRSWISTDPRKHIEIVKAANTAHGGDLVPIIKMIKGWNRKISSHFQSFHLEVLALAILNNVKISSYPSGVRFFFDKGRALVASQNPDPAGYGGDVGSYINTQEKINQAVSRFQMAYERALKAEDFAKRGNLPSAFDMWDKIFGDYFPAYG